MKTPAATTHSDSPRRRVGTAFDEIVTATPARPRPAHPAKIVAFPQKKTRRAGARTNRSIP